MSVLSSGGGERGEVLRFWGCRGVEVRSSVCWGCGARGEQSSGVRSLGCRVWGVQGLRGAGFEAAES